MQQKICFYLGTIQDNILTLHDMFKAQSTVLSAEEYLQKCQTEMSNKQMNSSVFKKEFHV